MRLSSITLYILSLTTLYNINGSTTYELNPGYGNGSGYTHISTPWYTNTATASTHQLNKLVVTGYIQANSSSDPYQIGLMRLTEQGQLDTSFGTNGYATLNIPTVSGYTFQAVPFAITTDSLHRIIVTGVAYSSAVNSHGSYSYIPYSFLWSSTGSSQLNLIVARFTADGIPDSSFGIQGTTGITGTIPTTGQVTGYTGQVAGTSNGVGGSLGFITLLLNNQLAPNAITVQSDDKIVITGQTNTNAMIVLRFLENGALDTLANGGSGFGTGSSSGTATGTANGYIVGSLLGASALWGYGITMTTDNKILVTGQNGANNGQTMLLRLTNQGILDTTFNNIGYIITSIPNLSSCGITVQELSNSKILVGGVIQNNNSKTSYSGVTMMYTANGLLDTTYGNGQGYVTITVPNYAINCITTTTYDNDNNIIITAGIASNQTNVAYANPYPGYTYLAFYDQQGNLNTSCTPTGLMLINQNNIEENLPTPTILYNQVKNVFTLGVNMKNDGMQGVQLCNFDRSLPLSLTYLDTYGYNSNLLADFLGVNFYAQIITDQAAQQACIDSVNNTLANYVDTYSNSDINFIAYLYLINPDLQAVKEEILPQYPDYIEEIVQFFNYLKQRILQLTIK